MNSTIDDLDTGDIILLCGGSESWLSWLTSIIKYSTHSNYTHIGVILKNPNFLANLVSINIVIYYNILIKYITIIITINHIQYIIFIL